MKNKIISFCIIFLLYLPYTAFSWKCVIYNYFDWFLAPVFKNIPGSELVYKNAVIGIFVLILSIKNLDVLISTQKQNQDDYKDNNGILETTINKIKDLFFTLIFPWITIFIGYLIFSSMN